VLAKVLGSAYGFCFDVTAHTARWCDYVSMLGDYVAISSFEHPLNTEGGEIAPKLLDRRFETARAKSTVQRQSVSMDSSPLRP
jgi:hypothetical protein